MRVLSLFDGMSCGQIALRNLGIVPEVYFASEVDKYAVAVTRHNFPDTVCLGDVRNVNASELGHIDLLIGGSPCQSFSFAGRRQGMSTVTKQKILSLSLYLQMKEEGFEFDGQSYLFWEYMRILTDLRKTNPNIMFLLENVEMGSMWESVLSHAIGVSGIHINSARVSAQVRKRIYWTNIRVQNDLFGELPYVSIPQPKDRNIHISDILEDDVDEKYYMSEDRVLEIVRRNEELLAAKGIVKIDRKGKIKMHQDKASSLAVGGHGCGNHSDMDMLYLSPLYLSEATKKGYTVIEDGDCFDLSMPTSTTRRGRKFENKAHCLMTGNEFCRLQNGRIRRLTTTECMRLQTIPEWYKWNCSDSQIYKMLGNGWTVDVISYILSFMNK